TEELVVPRSTGERVVAGAAEEVRAGQRAFGLVQSDDIVSALAEDLNERRVCYAGAAAADRHCAPIDLDDAGRVAADFDVVVEVIAEDGENPGSSAECGDYGRHLASGEGFKRGGESRIYRGMAFHSS